MEKQTLINYFNRLADGWDSSCHHDPAKLAMLMQLCQLQRGAKVLDIACGTGVLTPYLLDSGAGELVGVDISPRMIELAKDKFRDEHRVRFVCADIFDLSESRFDLAVIYSAFPHFDSKSSLLSHVAKLLSTGGRLMICHSDGKDRINAQHSEDAQPVSMSLQSAFTTSKIVQKWFEVDTVIDTPELYVISGRKVSN